MRIKICGVTRPEDAELAAHLGADALGLNFYEGSPRFLDRPRAEALLRGLPPFVEPVGVFVNPTAPQLRAWRQDLRTVQLHGADLASLADEVAAARWCAVPAFGVGDAADLARVTAALAGWPAAAVLLDAKAPGLHGGTGRTAPWDLLAAFRAPVPVLLAGGLTPENVAEAIRVVRPYAVDVAGGVEASPGVKDPEKLRRFLDNAREAATRLGL